MKHKLLISALLIAIIGWGGCSVQQPVSSGTAYNYSNILDFTAAGTMGERLLRPFSSGYE